MRPRYYYDKCKFRKILLFIRREKKLKLKEQWLYSIAVRHNKTIRGSLLWWILRKNNNCRKFCPTCHFYFRCQEDVALNNMLEGK